MRISLLVVVLVVVAAGGAGFTWQQLSHPPLRSHASLQMKPSPVAPGALRARFFGATTIQLDDGQTAVMTDGFFSRPGLMEVFFRDIVPDRSRIDMALRKGNVSKLAAVLVAHSHHDHAMDCAVVAHRTGALLVGSASTANIGLGYGMTNDQLRIVKHRDTLDFGRFTVEIFASPHSPGGSNRGEISAPLRPPVRASAYKEGGSYAFLLRHPQGTILIHPSANFVPGLYKGVKADAVFLSIGLLGKQSQAFARDYWREVVQATGAKLVIPIHWDDFTRPLDEPLRPMPHLMDDFEKGMRILRRLAEADGVVVRFMPLFDAVEILGKQNSGSG